MRVGMSRLLSGLGRGCAPRSGSADRPPYWGAAAGGGMDGGGWSVEAEAAPPGVVELVGGEPVRPVALVVLGGEVAGTRAGEECLADGGGVGLVAWAPGCGGDVHDVAPALLVLHGGDRVDHVAVPPDGVTGPDVRDAAERAQQQGV